MVVADVERETSVNKNESAVLCHKVSLGTWQNTKIMSFCPGCSTRRVAERAQIFRPFHITYGTLCRGCQIANQLRFLCESRFAAVDTHKPLIGPPSTVHDEDPWGMPS